MQRIHKLFKLHNNVTTPCLKTDTNIQQHQFSRASLLMDYARNKYLSKLLTARNLSQCAVRLITVTIT